MKKYLLISLGIFSVFLIPSGYYFLKQIGENRKISQYLSESDLGNSSDWDKAKQLSQRLRSDFEINESKFVSLNMSNRPFLRETAGYLLDIKEGQCGEGARVLVNLLNEAGYDATRITLYNKYLDAAHTLVSLKIGSNEYFIDTINTSNEINDFINQNQITSKSFKIVKYDSDVSKRTSDYFSLKEMANSDQENTENIFFRKFKYYSYEAIPYTKLFKVLGLDVRMLNFDRPPRGISSLAEKPYLLLSIVWLMLAICVFIFTSGLTYFFYRKTAKT